jgi:hypothetical protein
MSWLLVGSAIAPARGRLCSSDEREHVLLPEQHAAAGCALAADLAGHQPSIYCPYLDAADVSDLPFRQKPLVVGVFRRHDLFLSLVFVSRRATTQELFRAGRHVSARSGSIRFSIAASCEHDGAEGDLRQRDDLVDFDTLHSRCAMLRIHRGSRS